MEVMPDHVHMLVEAPPMYAPAKIVQLFKGISSRRLRQEFLDVIKNYIWKEGTLWAIGYYIGSVSDQVTIRLIWSCCSSSSSLSPGWIRSTTAK